MMRGKACCICSHLCAGERCVEGKSAYPDTALTSEASKWDVLGSSIGLFELNYERAGRNTAGRGQKHTPAAVTDNPTCIMVWAKPVLPESLEFSMCAVLFRAASQSITGRLQAHAAQLNS